MFNGLPAHGQFLHEKGEKMMKREYCSICKTTVIPTVVTQKEDYKLSGIDFTYSKRLLCCPHCSGEFYNQEVSLFNTESRRLSYLQAKERKTL